MQQHGSKTLPVYPDPDPGGGVKKLNFNICKNMVMLHIKLKGMTNAAACKHVFCPYTHLEPEV